MTKRVNGTSVDRPTLKHTQGHKLNFMGPILFIILLLLNWTGSKGICEFGRRSKCDQDIWVENCKNSIKIEKKSL